MKKLFTFKYGTSDVTFLKDGSFTLCWASYEAPDRTYNGYGMAFKAHDDVDDVEIGCREALVRLFINLSIPRNDRVWMMDRMRECVAFYKIGHPNG